MRGRERSSRLENVWADDTIGPVLAAVLPRIATLQILEYVLLGSVHALRA